MKFNLRSPQFLTGVALVALALVAVSIRVFLPYDAIFSAQGIKFSSIDAYYQMRLIDNLVHNFPHLNHFDPYLIFPTGAHINDIHFFNWIAAAIIWVIGFGSPSQHLVDVLGVYFPVILAGLVIFPVYFIGRTLFNRWVGLFAAAMISVLSGEYLGRSILGFTDQHIAEVLFTTTAMMFLILALKAADARGLSFRHFAEKDWKTVRKPLIYALLAGLFLGFFLLTWLGGPMFLFIIALAFVILFIIRHMQGRKTEDLFIVSFAMFFVAFIMYIPNAPTTVHSIAAIGTLIAAAGCYGLSYLVRRMGLKNYWYPAGLVGLVVVAALIVWVASPHLMRSVFHVFSVFAPSGNSATTTLEMQPFLSPNGSFSTGVAWGNFTTSFLLWSNIAFPGVAFFSLVFLIVVAVRKPQENWLLWLLLVWTLVILFATIGQRRFAYYFAVNIALLSGFFIWKVMWYIGLRKLDEPVEEAPAPRSKKRPPKKRLVGSLNIYHVNAVLAFIVLFFYVIFPNIGQATDVAKSASFTPSDGWQQALTWLRDNSVEPLGQDSYYARYQPPAAGEPFVYPATAYGVLSWWDYGYWITRTAHRIPDANPSQNAASIQDVADFMLLDATDVQPASQGGLSAAAQDLFDRLDPQYVITDYATSTTKFWAVVQWGDKVLSDYTDVFLYNQNGQYVAVNVYYPKYFQTLIVRLYNFDGKAITSTAATVLKYSIVRDSTGTQYKTIDDYQTFSSYEAAQAYINSQTDGGNYVIVGLSAFLSPVNVPAVDQYQLVYSSNFTKDYGTNLTVPEVKVLERTP